MPKPETRPESYDGIPGTYVFDLATARRGGERAGFMSQALDEMFLDAVEGDPLALTRIGRREYMERAGAEAIELIMWLVMRGTLDERVRRVHRYYQLGVSLTGAGLVALESTASSTP